MMSSIDYNYTTINNFHNLDDDNIVMMAIINVDVAFLRPHYAPRRFIRHMSHSANAAFDLMSNVLPDRKRNNVNVSWCYISNVSANHYIATYHLRWQK